MLLCCPARHHRIAIFSLGGPISPPRGSSTPPLVPRKNLVAPEPTATVRCVSLPNHSLPPQPCPAPRPIFCRTRQQNRNHGRRSRHQHGPHQLAEPWYVAHRISASSRTSPARVASFGSLLGRDVVVADLPSSRRRAPQCRRTTAHPGRRDKLCTSFLPFAHPRSSFRPLTISRTVTIPSHPRPRVGK